MRTMDEARLNASKYRDTKELILQKIISISLKLNRDICCQGR